MKQPSILHIAQDEKFISAARYLFEKAFPGNNRFVIIKPAANPPLRYIDDQIDADFLVHSSSTVPELVEMSRKAKVVIFHGINRLKGSVFLKSPDKHKFVGFIYGAEVFNSDIYGDDFLGSKSRALDRKLQKKTMIDRFKDLYRRIRYHDTKNMYEDISMKDVFHGIKYYGFTDKETLKKYIKKGILNPASRMVPFSYYPLDYTMKNDDLRADGPNILLGNSASATNNHLEALDLLKSFALNGRKVITPLSYGHDDYADAVESYGKQQLPRNFESVRTFMPLQEYNRLISSCSYVVMNHYRSQAMGNLITSLYLGAKVFLNKTDAYYFFKKLGCYVYQIDEDLVKEGTAGLSPLSQEQVKHNRRVLRKKLSTDVLVGKLRQSFMDYFDI